jgi:Tfp pilus assembly protein PilV
MLIYQKGFSLIEALLSGVIVAVVLLEVMQLQAKSLEGTNQSYQLSVAVIQAESMVERLRANCQETFRAREYELWLDENTYLFPESKSSYSCGATLDHCQVNISWGKHHSRNFTLDGSVTCESR